VQHDEAIIREAILAVLGATKLPAGTASYPRLILRALTGRVVEKPVPLARRLRLYRCDRYLVEVQRRGLPTYLDLIKNGAEPLHLTDETTTADGYPVALLSAEGWADYSRRSTKRFRTLSILAGRDDAGYWAVRVPGTIGSVAAGLRWLEPAVVRKAREDGRRVLRQGDIFIVERTRDAMADTSLPSGHTWDAATRTLTHGAHAHLHVPFPALPVPQSTLPSNGIGRRRGD
jgi:hypothetical protein